MMFQFFLVEKAQAVPALPSESPPLQKLRIIFSSHPFSFPLEVAQAVPALPSPPLQNLRCEGAFAAHAVSSNYLFLHRVLFCLRARDMFFPQKKRKYLRKRLRLEKLHVSSAATGSGRASPPFSAAT